MKVELRVVLGLFFSMLWSGAQHFCEQSKMVAAVMTKGAKRVLEGRKGGAAKKNGEDKKRMQPYPPRHSFFFFFCGFTSNDRKQCDCFVCALVAHG